MVKASMQVALRVAIGWAAIAGQDSLVIRGPVAQWIRHLTTNQGIAGSSPARINIFLNFLLLGIEEHSPTDRYLGSWRWSRHCWSRHQIWGLKVWAPCHRRGLLVSKQDQQAKFPTQAIVSIAAAGQGGKDPDRGRSRIGNRGQFVNGCPSSRWAEPLFKCSPRALSKTSHRCSHISGYCMNLCLVSFC